MSKFIVLDGNSLANRAFYAIPLLTTAKGVFTNAAYGFTNMLLRIIQEEKPCYLAVAFDKSKAHVRIAEYAEYKSNRKGNPDELRSQFPIIKEILTALDIPVFELEGYEADDLIGTLIRKSEAQGWNNIIFTGDKDALQLISPQTVVALTKKGISETEVVDELALREKWNLTPRQVIDLKGLMGDPSDNIPGVPGVGEKTALKLLWEFGNVEEVLEHVDQVNGKKLQENLRGNVELARLSKRLATIITDVPIELDLERCALTEPDYPKLLELFKELEFKNLIKNITDKIMSTNPLNTIELPTDFREPAQVANLSGYEELRAFILSLTSPIGIYLEYAGDNPRSGNITGVGLSGSNGVCGYLGPETLEDEAVWSELEQFFTSPQAKVVHDYKKAYSYLIKRNISLKEVELDIMLAAYLVNPSSGKYSLSDLAFEQLNLVLNQEPGYLGKRSSVVGQLALIYREKLKDLELWPLFEDIELPLARILGKMELQGVSVDRSQLNEMGLKLAERLGVLELDIYTLAGDKFNINSPQQLGVILFDRLGLPVLKKTKTGYSTSAEVLEELSPKHQIIPLILEYRQLAKLNSTYVEGLKGIQDQTTGKVHTSFNQTITATGRLSSTEPNLQNIPIRLELGRKIRKAFVPSCPDSVILAADYSQIELRILAHISGDENLQSAFRNQEDIHTRTASEVFGVSMDEVTSELRRRAKAVNFGIVYGISDFGLSQDIGVSRKEAKEYIESYFARYPKVKGWMEDVIKQAREDGFVRTIYNRRRNLPDLFASNRMVRASGERTAMNTPIQGTAADIIKLAMVKMDLALAGYKTKLLLQVHDELIFEVPNSELAEMKQLVKETMEHAYPMAIPLEVDLKVGPNWYELNKI
jgi:DNA polymerase I